MDFALAQQSILCFLFWSSPHKTIFFLLRYPWNDQDESQKKEPDHSESEMGNRMFHFFH